MDLKIAARMIAVLAVGAGLTATLMAVGRPRGAEEAPVFRSADPGGDPDGVDGRAELRHCRDLGTNALNDTGCRKAWMESRRRFLQVSPTTHPSAPASGAEVTVAP
ncbi:hypothetical protein NA8A_12220 [Nitratireductor indicus C115]|uniref:Conjugal transfer protein TrbK n=1 Tax=Nitratireductor indicus C115 TaxID=1231190 RepID=K2NSK1_9HYPH|nr:putative entry exclusion protein TrbK-alt [Nitratireductor indicus]EKF42315.1 hypothetical protein NA8A_12220 [Nitratireductor indicus C115]SFQ59721.1 conjugative transfer region protein TrbK [Nitratireductor indicus]